MTILEFCLLCITCKQQIYTYDVLTIIIFGNARLRDTDLSKKTINTVDIG